jgi:hypothetical protein
VSEKERERGRDRKKAEKKQKKKREGNDGKEFLSPPVTHAHEPITGSASVPGGSFPAPLFPADQQINISSFFFLLSASTSLLIVLLVGTGL